MFEFAIRHKRENGKKSNDNWSNRVPCLLLALGRGGVQRSFLAAGTSHKEDWSEINAAQ